MKTAKDKFLEMYMKLPIKAKRELIVLYPKTPITLCIAAPEIMFETRLGEKILKELGYEED